MAVLAGPQRLNARLTNYRELIYQVAWALSLGTKREITPADVAVLQKKVLNKWRVVCSGPDEERTRLEVSWR